MAKVVVLFIKLLKDVTGAHFKPVEPAYLLNEDCSGQYYCSRTQSADKMNNGWSRMTTSSLTSRNKDSMWTSDDTKNTTCKGVRVNFACGGSSAGNLYPIVILISNLSKDDFASNNFKVLPIKGLCINGNIDPRCKEIGYVCLMDQI